MMSLRAISCSSLLALLAFTTAPAGAADLPGAKDPAFLKRFQGSEIINYETAPFDTLAIGAPDPKNPNGAWIRQPAEGQITRIVYHVPSGHSALELLRNYEQALKSAGLTQVDEKRGNTDEIRDFGGLIYNQSWENAHDFMWSNLGLSGVQQWAFVSARGNVGGKAVKVQVLVMNYRSPSDVTYKNKVHFNPDQPVVVLDVVSAAPLGAQMAAGGSKADMAGAKDPAPLKRFKGSTIIDSKNIAYDEVKIAAPDPRNPGTNWLLQSYEGAIARAVYQLPVGHSMLETLRNYQQEFKADGLTQVDELVADGGTARDFAGKVFHQTWETNGEFLWSNLGLSATQAMGYTTAMGTVGGKAVKVQVYVATYNGPSDVTYNNKKVHFDPMQPVAVVDVVTSKPLVTQMVTVKASDMANQLKKGAVELYGIYFDVDKTDIKMESTATMNEIASLLKSDPTLKLEISGHTDNTGSKDHNVTLSQGRAESVRGMLVSKYGIDGSRLTAKGYGDTKPVAPNTNDASKAKNRRVELRKV